MNPFLEEAYGKPQYRREIFNKSFIIWGEDPEEYRRDIYGNIIAFSEYGYRSDYGWHVDHIHPKSLDGSNLLCNLQPLHWRTNISLGNTTEGKLGWKTYYLRKWCIEDH